MQEPYIGITGATTRREAELLASLQEGKDSTHVPMTGFLVSDIVLDKGHDPDHSHYVSTGELPDALEAGDGRVLNTIHYNTHNRDRVVDEVRQVFSIGDIYDRGLCRTVQLNMPWPLREEIDGIRETHPDTRFIMSLSSHWTGDTSEEEVPDRVADEYGDVEYVLIDPSRGKGKRFDPAESGQMFTALRDRGHDGVIGFAGGLDPTNVTDVVGDVREEIGTPDFAIDAQSGLRSGSERRKETDLDLDKAKRYVDGAHRDFQP